MRVKFMALVCLSMCACQPGLEHQAKIGVLAEPRMPVEGTIAYQPIDQSAPAITRALVMRGKERFEIYCSVCHGLSGEGDGLATERGFGRPKSFADLKADELNIEHIQTTIEKGEGRMYPFADRIPFADRYAVAAYTQVLNLRLKFPVSKLTDTDQKMLTRNSE